MNTPHHRIALYYPLAFIALLVFAYYLYMQGIGGFFLFDDFPNLTWLENIKAGVPWKKWLGEIFSGLTGRPLAMFSFALQASDWPADPAGFRKINILLHLLNGTLLAIFAWRISALLEMRASGRPIFVLAVTAFWLLHPIQISSVLYIVQRMVELSTLFTLLGLLAYVHGRSILPVRPAAGYLWMTTALVFGVIATLGKETGVLLLAYMLVLDATLLRGIPVTGGFKWWRRLLVILPIVGITVYLFSFIWFIAPDAYGTRNFTLLERLMTEPRVVLDYLAKIAAPRLSGFDFYYDDFSVSRGLLNPAQTLPAIGAIGLTIWLAWRWRMAAPALSFGILWYFAGQSLESTILPLELYFEHRNYLPMAGLVFAAAYYAVTRWESLSSLSAKALFMIPAMAYLGYLTIISWNTAALWNDSLKQALVWAAEHPQSIRAQENAGGLWRNAGQYEETLKIEKRILQEHPKYVGAYFLWLQLTCLDNSIPLPESEEVEHRARIADHSHIPVVYIGAIIDSMETGGCKRIKPDDLLSYIRALLANPKYRDSVNLHMLKAKIYALKGMLNPAMEAADNVHRFKARPDVALIQAHWLASADLYDDALRYVAMARRLNGTFNPLRRLKYSADIEAMEKNILKLKDKQ